MSVLGHDHDSPALFLKSWSLAFVYIHTEPYTEKYYTYVHACRTVGLLVPELLTRVMYRLVTINDKLTLVYTIHNNIMCGRIMSKLIYFIYFTTFNVDVDYW